jgi:sulfite reductase (ferredoxin)
MSPTLTEVGRDIAAEIDNFEAEAGRYVRGELGEERFRSFRLAHGIYGQRQPGVQMIRVKIPAGSVNGKQLSRMADIAERFGNGMSHLTTRQDVQFHFVKLADVPRVMRSLAEVGLTTREACGNSVRNVTACPLAGFIADEQFDVRPYALGTHAYLTRNPFCQQLARKFKIALSACPEDCAATAIHDIGLLGRVEGGEGRVRYGFKVVVGGGLGATPFTAQVLDQFVPVGELLITLKAILNVAADHGNRRSKAKARLKFVVHRVGIEAFKVMVAEAKAGLTAEERREADVRRYVPQAFAPVVAWHWGGRPPLGRNGHNGGPACTEPQGRPGDGHAEDESFVLWRSCSVRAHKDPARAVVTVMVPMGDLESHKLRALGDLVNRFGGDGGDGARIAINQNLVLPDVKREDLRALYDGLRGCGLAEIGAGTALDVTSCPGADTCNLGITSSKGMARAIRAELTSLTAGGAAELAGLRDLTIKISGCPNSCGQHHIAAIGLHGVAKKIGDRQVPAYQLHLGGKVGNGEARIGRAAYKLAAREVPNAVTALLDLHRRLKAPGESFSDFIARVPQASIDAALEPSPAQRDHDAPEELFVDWGQSAPYTTDDLGTGECAGAGTDLADGPFDNYEAELLQALLFMQRGQWADALANLNRSQYTLARVLLKEAGKSPESDYECVCELRARIIDRGHSSDLWNEQHEKIGLLLRTRTPDPRAVEAIHGGALLLLAESKKVLERLARLRAVQAPEEVPG